MSQGFSQALEDPFFAQFRRSLVPQFNKELQNLQQPIFGDAQKASFLSNLNDLTNSSISSLKSNLARSGALDSGRLGAGLTDIGLGRLSQGSQFFSQLPFLEEQTRRQGVGNLLGQGMNWAGRAPISQFNIGQQSGQQQFQGEENKTGQQTQQGPPWWRSMLSGLGGAAGATFGELASGGNPFGLGDWIDELNFNRGH